MNVKDNDAFADEAPHRADFFVEWADGRVTRPLVFGTFDLNSGRVLSLQITPMGGEAA
ncbi:MAG: hypothetical protein GX413_10080 [Acetobacter sp.]|nr:hypothetical protein [Acetobacter sp.]